MVVNTKEVITCAWRFLVLLIGNICRSAYEQPLAVGMFFFLLLLYRCLPYLLGFLVSSSPVIICTGLLLGILLSYGEPDTPETEDTKMHECLSQAQDASDAVVLEKAAHFSLRVRVRDQDKKDESTKKFLKSDLLDDSTESSNLVDAVRETRGSSAVDGLHDPSWGLVDCDDASESDSDHAESSSPDASMADIIPMLDELHPLLDSEDPGLVNAPSSDVHSSSGTSTDDSESDDGSGDKEIENTEEGLDEETKENKGDGAALAVRWTEDDEKNVMVLGTSELERNQRLENLIAKRKARKNLIERNLIDLDCGETITTVHGLSRVHVQIPPRHNPFDFPYDSDEPFCLNSIPGSAPSVLLPRQNPFDSPHAPDDEGSKFSGFPLNPQGFSGFPQREMVFRRHESFAHDVRMRPYFVSERTRFEETSYPHLQRQPSDASESKESSTNKSDSASSISNQDSENELREEKMNQETEADLVLEPKTDQVEDSSSDEADSVDLVDLQAIAPEVLETEDKTQHEIDSSPQVSNPATSSALIHEPGGGPTKDSTPLRPLSVEADAVNDCLSVEPVYDSSPSAVGKSRARITSHVEVSLSNTESHRLPPSLLSYVEENQPRSREVDEIREQDAVHIELSETMNEYEYINVSKLEKAMSGSSSASMKSEQGNSDPDALLGEDYEREEKHEPVSSSGMSMETGEMPVVGSVSADAKRADDEALLSELDAIGDFHVEEFRLNERTDEKYSQGDEARQLSSNGSPAERKVTDRSVVSGSSSSASTSKEKDETRESDSSSSSSSDSD